MENAFSKVEELAATLKEYVNSKIESIKLHAAEKISMIIANAVGGIVVVVLFLFFLGLASIAFSYFLGEWIGKIWVGFLIVGGIYLLIGTIVWIARKSIIQIPVMNAIIRQLFANDEED